LKPGPDVAESESGGELEEEIGDEDDEKGEGIAVADVEVEGGVHASDMGVG